MDFEFDYPIYLHVVIIYTPCIINLLFKYYSVIKN